MFKFATLTLGHFYRLFLIIAFTMLSASCNTSSTEGPVWFGDPVMTDQLDKNGDPINPKTTFEAGTKTVYCHLTLRGPVEFKMFVRWYHEKQLVYEEYVNFGKVRKVSPNLTFIQDNKEQPLPAGNYRCDFSLGGDSSSRSINFIIEDIAY